jgi:hypothetical protein
MVYIPFSVGAYIMYLLRPLYVYSILYSGSLLALEKNSTVCGSVKISRGIVPLIGIVIAYISRLPRRNICMDNPNLITNNPARQQYSYTASSEYAY